MSNCRETKLWSNEAAEAVIARAMGKIASMVQPGYEDLVRSWLLSALHDLSCMHHDSMIAEIERGGRIAMDALARVSGVPHA